jgi:hypothetical protein
MRMDIETRTIDSDKTSRIKQSTLGTLPYINHNDQIEFHHLTGSDRMCKRKQGYALDTLLNTFEVIPSILFGKWTGNAILSVSSESLYYACPETWTHTEGSFYLLNPGIYVPKTRRIPVTSRSLPDDIFIYCIHIIFSISAKYSRITREACDVGGIANSRVGAWVLK